MKKILSSPPGSGQTGQTRTYDRATSVVFLKTDEPFGGLSNMARGFSLHVNGMRILTSEALYQACRFPHLPDIQRLIIKQTSPITAKMRSKPYRKDSRPDWDRVRVKIMRWCLRVKLAQNWDTFSALLLKTGDRPIVEQSRKDDFWGAKTTDPGVLVGKNVLGRLLMELREAVKTENRDTLCRVQPLAIPDFFLGGRPIGIVGARDSDREAVEPDLVTDWPPIGVDEEAAVQPTLFAAPISEKLPSPPYQVGNSRGMHVADLAPYPLYKDSGLAWLGEIPSGWRIVRNGSLFGQRNQTGFGGLPILEVSLKTGVRVRNFETSKRKQIMADLDKYKYAACGDIAYNMMRMWQGAVGVVPVDGLVSPAYVVARPFAEVESRFFATLFRTADYMAEVDSYSRGIVKDRNRLYWEQFKQMASPLPPPPEQAAIVRFLDWATGRLDRAIRAKRKVIALLNEQKQAIIHHAVTRGLEPSVPLKPSGIPWLGEIPQHWVQRALWTVSSLRTERNPGGLPLLSVFLNRGVIRYEEGGGQVHAPSLDLSNYQVVRVSDFVLNNQQAWRGSVGVSFHEGIISPAYIVLQMSAQFDGRFANYLMRSRALVDQFVAASKGVGDIQRQVFWPFLRMVQIPLPPMEEQRAIVKHVETATYGLSTSLSRLEREIDLLREYRTRLVADVVTGKLDVREAASRLPDETPQEASQDATDLIGDPEAVDEEAAA